MEEEVEADPAVVEKVKSLVESRRVVLFMKGQPEDPLWNSIPDQL